MGFEALAARMNPMNTSKQDLLFSRKRKLIQNFNFGKETTAVFDDMLSRSIPFYEEIQRMIREMAATFAVPGTNIYDLGCSTCNTFIGMNGSMPPDLNYIGLDSSQDMLDKAREKLISVGFNKNFELILCDLNKPIPIKNASVVILNLTLQFIRPLHRERMIQNIVQGMNEGGCLLLVEKVLSPNSTINRLFIKYYYDFKKKNGYSELEIAQKREALENVLIPYHFEENRELLLNNGFKSCDSFFRWYNFCGFLAIK